MKLCTYSSTPVGREDYAVNCVTWHDARAFCLRAGGDLPTEVQWEYAAAAAGKAFESHYPWGADAPSCDDAVFARWDPFTYSGFNHSDCAISGGPAMLGPAPVTAGPSDVTPLGIHGLAGGVIEHVRDSLHPYAAACWAASVPQSRECLEQSAPMRAGRGGAWSSGASDLYAPLRAGAQPMWMEVDQGLRCAYSPEPAGR